MDLFEPAVGAEQSFLGTQKQSAISFHKLEMVSEDGGQVLWVEGLLARLLKRIPELSGSYAALLCISYLQRLTEQDSLHHTGTAVCTAVIEKHAD